MRWFNVLDEAKETLKDQAELVQDDLEENFTIVIDAVKDNAKDLVDGVKTVVFKRFLMMLKLLRQV